MATKSHVNGTLRRRRRGENEAARTRSRTYNAGFAAYKEYRTYRCTKELAGGTASAVDQWITEAMMAEAPADCKIG